jgi:hypothetical protein
MSRSIWVVALVVSVTVLAEADACRRSGYRRTYHNSCGLPSWVRCKIYRQPHRHPDQEVPKCLPPHSCYCCDAPGGMWQPCGDGGGCEPGTMVCTAGIPPFDCPSHYHMRPFIGDRRLFAMVRDRITNRMRFARPWECNPYVYGWYPLWALGVHCHPPKK